MVCRQPALYRERARCFREAVCGNSEDVSLSGAASEERRGSFVSPWSRPALVSGGNERNSPAVSGHGGLVRLSVKDENMILKLMLILSASLMFAPTECRSQAGTATACHSSLAPLPDRCFRR